MSFGYVQKAALQPQNKTTKIKMIKTVVRDMTDILEIKKSNFFQNWSVYDNTKFYFVDINSCSFPRGQNGNITTNVYVIAIDK